MLVDAFVLQGHDAGVRAGFGAAFFDDPCFNANSVAMENGFWKGNIGHAKIGDCGAVGRFMHGNADDQAERE